MRYNGEIEKLNHIIVSDPSYDKDVTCRYEKTGMNETDWKIDIDIENVEDRFYEYTLKGIEFYIFLVKNRNFAELGEKGSIKYLRGIKIEETEIGIDTACIAFGINEKADEIIEVQDIWQPEESIKTLTDGLFGTVKEGTKNDEPVFIWISGYITDDAGYSIQDIVDYIQKQFKVKDLTKEMERVIDIRKGTIEEQMKNLEIEFKEITEKDKKLSSFFGKKKGYTNISFASIYLAKTDLRNQQRKAGILYGELEEIPFSDMEVNMIKEYNLLQQQYAKEVSELEKNDDLDLNY